MSFANLLCPKCGVSGSCILLHLDDLTVCTCAECEDEFEIDDVRGFIESWQAVLVWLEQSSKAESEVTNEQHT